jgi:predicted nucleic acid-binding protein
MSGEASREFVDTNVLVYAFDSSAGQKHERARALLDRLWDSDSGCLSVQVLQEFFVVITRKVPRPLPARKATERMHELSAWHVFCPDADDVVAAARLHESQGLSFWDALIVHAASELGCEALWSEDLQSDRAIRGVRVRNPFLD